MLNRLPALIGKKQNETNAVIDVSALSEATGVSRTTIYNWLEGKMRRFDADTIEAFCAYFGCNVGDLLIYEPKESPEPTSN